MKLTPPTGHKRVCDWIGLRVRTLREMRNEFGCVPAGAIATSIAPRAAGTGLALEFDPCACCGVRIRVSDVPANWVEVIPST